MKRVIRLFITVLCLMLLMGCNHSPEPRKLCSNGSLSKSLQLSYGDPILVVDDYSYVQDGDESELEAIAKNRCDTFDKLCIME